MLTEVGKKGNQKTHSEALLNIPHHHGSKVEQEQSRLWSEFVWL